MIQNQIRKEARRMSSGESIHGSGAARHSCYRHPNGGPEDTRGASLRGSGSGGKQVRVWQGRGLRRGSVAESRPLLHSETRAEAGAVLDGFSESLGQLLLGGKRGERAAGGEGETPSRPDARNRTKDEL